MLKTSIGFFDVQYRIKDKCKLSDFNGILFITLIVDDLICLFVNRDFIEDEDEIREQLRVHLDAKYNIRIIMCSDNYAVLKSILLHIENDNFSLLTTWFLGYDIEMLKNNVDREYLKNIIEEIRTTNTSITEFPPKDQRIILIDAYKNLNIISGLPLYVGIIERPETYRLFYIIKNVLGEEYIYRVPGLVNYKGLEYTIKAQSEYKIPYIIENVFSVLAYRELNNRFNFLPKE